MQKLFLATLFICLIAVPLNAATSQYAGEQVIEAVNQLIQNTQDEQNAQQIQYFDQQQKCNDDTVVRNQAIQDAQDSIQASQTALAASQAAYQADVQEISTLNDAITAAQSQIIALQNQRDAEKALFDSNVEEHENTITNIGIALDMIGQFANYDNINQFVQLGSQVNKIFKNAVATKNTKHIIGLIQVMATIQTNSGQYVATADVQKLYDLFNTLKSKVEASLSDLIQVETDAISLFNFNVQNLQDQIDAFNTRLSLVTAHSGEMADSINKENSITQEAQDKITRNQNILDATTAACNAFFDSYNSQTQARTEHIQLLQQLLQILQSTITNYNGNYSALLQAVGLDQQEVENLHLQAQGNKNKRVKFLKDN